MDNFVKFENYLKEKGYVLPDTGNSNWLFDSELNSWYISGTWDARQNSNINVATDSEIILDNCKGPALIDKYGRECYFEKGIRHRIDGPAIIYKNSYYWYRDDIWIFSLIKENRLYLKNIDIYLDEKIELKEILNFAYDEETFNINITLTNNREIFCDYTKKELILTGIKSSKIKNSTSFKIIKNEKNNGKNYPYYVENNNLILQDLDGNNIIEIKNITSEIGEYIQYLNASYYHLGDDISVHLKDKQIYLRDITCDEITIFDKDFKVDVKYCTLTKGITLPETQSITIPVEKANPIYDETTSKGFIDCIVKVGFDICDENNLVWINNRWVLQEEWKFNYLEPEFVEDNKEVFYFHNPSGPAVSYYEENIRVSEYWFEDQYLFTHKDGNIYIKDKLVCSMEEISSFHICHTFKTDNKSSIDSFDIIGEEDRQKFHYIMDTGSFSYTEGYTDAGVTLKIDDKKIGEIKFSPGTGTTSARTFSGTDLGIGASEAATTYYNYDIWKKENKLLGEREIGVMADKIFTKNKLVGFNLIFDKEGIIISTPGTITHSNKESQLSEEVISAAYRVATNQITKISQQYISQYGDQNWQQFLQTEVGKSFISTILGYLLTYLPQTQDSERAQKLAEEFRVEGLATLGNYFMDILTDTILKITQELPESTRIEEITEELEQEEDIVDNKCLEL